MSLSMDICTVYRTTNNYSSPKGTTIIDLVRHVTMKKNVNENGRLITSSEQLDWRYSQNSIGSTEKDTLEKEFYEIN